MYEASQNAPADAFADYITGGRANLIVEQLGGGRSCMGVLHLECS